MNRRESMVAMVAAARHCAPVGADGDARARANAGQLALETGLPAPTVQKLVSKLTSAGLLRSSRGIGGGLKLARPAAAITLADIVEAVEGPIALTDCASEVGGDNTCGRLVSCPTRDLWLRVRDSIAEVLDSTSLLDLVGPRSIPRRYLTPAAWHNNSRSSMIM